MKKKGFTLIELLAVIVILAIIAVIITPVISNIIESAREASSKSSAQGYIDAVKNRISLSILDYSSLEGTKTVSELESEVEYKGKRIDRGLVTVENDELREAKLCVNNYSFRYHNNSITKSDINYCVDESNIEVTILGTTTTELLKNQYSYDVDLSGTDISSATNIVCNNNAVPSLNGNTFHIDNIYGDTKCSIESSIVDTFTNLDDTTNNVVMIADETIASTLTVSTGKDVVLDLNGKLLDLSSKNITVNGNLAVNSSVRGTLKSSGGVIKNENTLIVNNNNIISTNTNNSSAICSNGKAVINNAYIEGVYGVGCHNNNGAETIINSAEIVATKNVVAANSGYSANVIIKSGTFSSDKMTINNRGDGDVHIYGGTYISKDEHAILNNASGTVNITQTDTPIYITTLAQVWKPAIANLSTGVVNITANKANACTATASDTISGLCVYAEGTGDSTTDAGNGAIMNSYNGEITAGQAIVNINGGTYYGKHLGITNQYSGTINISDADFTSGNVAVRNLRTGTVNITSGIYTGIASFAIQNSSSGIVNITQSDTPIYITSLAQAWKPAINNTSSGTINITANQANACTATASDTTSGLCVYAEGDKNYTTGSANVALALGDTSTAAININGGTYYGGNVTVSASGGTTNIRNAKLLSGYYAILGTNTSAINICNSSIETPSHDIYVRTAGPVINYTSDVVFRNGTNTPTITTNNGTINAVGTCPISE